MMLILAGLGMDRDASLIAHQTQRSVDDQMRQMRLGRTYRTPETHVSSYRHQTLPQMQ